MITTMTDVQELSAAVRELRNRFVAMTEPHRPALWRYCLRLTGSPWDAEDLVQETLTDFPLLELEDIRAALRYAARSLDHPVLVA